MNESMNRRRLLQVAGVLAVGAGGARFARAFDDKAADDQEEEIPLSKVPEKVKTAADKAVTGAKWEAAFLMTEVDEKFYELEGRDSKGREVTVTITPEGTVEEISTLIPLKAVPEPVTAALKAKLPRFKPALVFEIREGGKIAGFEFEGRRPNDREDIAVFVSADGKTIEVDDE